MNCKTNLRFYLLLYIIFGSSLSYSGPTENVHYKVLESEECGHSTSGKKLLVINSEQQFQTELKKYPMSSHHDVDFIKHSVVIINMEKKPTSGYNIVVESVVEDDENAIITFFCSNPEGDECVSEAEADPYIIIDVETKKNIIFKERTVIESEV